MHLWHVFMAQIGGWIGLIASVTGLVSVYYAIKNDILIWPTGIVSVILFGWVFWVTKAYSNAWLQILYYLPIYFYGWYVWLRCGPKRNDDLPITVLTTRARIGWAVVTIAASIIWGYYERKFTDAPMPWCDASLTVVSIVAQYLQARKIFENWILWILSDVVYAFYFLPRQGLGAVAGLYFIFLVMGIVGIRAWVKLIRSAGDKSAIEAYKASVEQDQSGLPS